MLHVLERLPAKVTLKIDLNILLNIWPLIWRVAHLHAQNYVVAQFADRNVLHRKFIIALPIATSLPNTPGECFFYTQTTTPFLGLSATFRIEVGTSVDLLDPVLTFKFIQASEGAAPSTKP